MAPYQISIPLKIGGRQHGILSIPSICPFLLRLISRARHLPAPPECREYCSRCEIVRAHETERIRGSSIVPAHWHVNWTHPEQGVNVGSVIFFSLGNVPWMHEMFSHGY